MIKKLLAMVLVVALAFSNVVVANAAGNSIKLVIDGTTVEPSVAPVVVSGTTLVPLRVATETLGAIVSWNSKLKQATVRTAGYTVVFTIDSKNYTVNNVKKTLTAAPQIISGTTMVPLRALSEAIGADVSYANNTVTVKYFTTMTGTIKISGSTTVQPIAQAAANDLMKMNTGLSVTVAGGGSGAGLTDSKAGTNNLGMSSSELKVDDLAVIDAMPIALDGIAVILNPKNPVKNLTKDQLSKILLGETKNWKDVGGNDAPILVQTRETGSGTLGTILDLITAKKALVTTATPHASSDLMVQGVASEANAIGYVSLGFLNSTVKAITLNNVMPTDETVKAGSYVLGRSLYMLSKGTPTSVYAKFVDYMRSSKFQKDFVSKEYIRFQ